MKTTLMQSMLWGGLALLAGVTVAAGQTSTETEPILPKTFNLAGERTPVIQKYKMESKLINYAQDGSRKSTDIFRLRLKWVPAAIAGTAGDVFTCEQFTVQLGDSPAVTIPALDHWSYILKLPASGLDEKGQVFGIDHQRFEQLADSQGSGIPPDKVYHVYNAFVDFHSLCSVFAEKTSTGAGIQDLHLIGQKIIHDAAFSEPPVNLGSNIATGSYFKNGEITLEFKGLSVVNGRRCAIIGYDSGNSQFKMIVNAMPDLQVQSVGSSHYQGDLYKELKSNWIQKAVLTEWVVSATTVPTLPNKINAVTERNILISNVTGE